MKSRKSLIVVLLLMSVLGSAWAQAPYKHSIGVTAGNLNALSYKTFFGSHLGLQLDLGYKYIYTDGENLSGVHISSLELNPNLMYEGHFTKGLYGFIGGGVSLGYRWNYWGSASMWDYGISYRQDNGKFGVNAIAGLEYKFSIPLTLQLDFRPGYGLLFDDSWDWSYFDWGVNLGIRYTF
ncbi:MAG: PorT family protein [Bacteroidales bacterium]|nr:PorT family protein [Bacteroidales bacterium]